METMHFMHEALPDMDITFVERSKETTADGDSQSAVCVDGKQEDFQQELCLCQNYGQIRTANVFKESAFYIPSHGPSIPLGNRNGLTLSVVPAHLNPNGGVENSIDREAAFAMLARVSPPVVTPPVVVTSFLEVGDVDFLFSIVMGIFELHGGDLRESGKSLFADDGSSNTTQLEEFEVSNSSLSSLRGDIARMTYEFVGSVIEAIIEALFADCGGITSITSVLCNPILQPLAEWDRKSASSETPAQQTSTAAQSRDFRRRHEDKAFGSAFIYYGIGLATDTEANNVGWFYVGLGIFSWISIVIAIVDLSRSETGWLFLLHSVLVLVLTLAQVVTGGIAISSGRVVYGVSILVGSILEILLFAIYIHIQSKDAMFWLML
ncbi:hypothetical protein Aperf_G00000115631 [Anoplocephala perfoliata]